MNQKQQILCKELQKEANYYGDLINKLTASISNAPDGRLRVSRSRDKFTYYYLSKDTPAGTGGNYIKRSELELAKLLAQKDYDIKLLEIIKGKKELIDSFLHGYALEDIERLKDSLCEGKRALVEPRIIDDELCLNRWRSAAYEGKRFAQGSVEIYTNRGERVRSKSEKIIADRLDFLGIEYKYECPLQLKHGITIYPDFTLWSLRKNEEIYLEHLGLMDDSDYSTNAVKRINQYEESDIYLGDRLVISMETANQPLNIRLLERKLLLML